MTQHDAGNDEQANQTKRPASKAGWVVMLVAGIIFILGSFGPLIGGIALASVSPADQNQYMSTGKVNLNTTSFAITSPSADVGSPDARYLPVVHLLFAAESTDNQPIFVGIARTADVGNYLSNVPHTIVNSIDGYPIDVHYQNVQGTEIPAPPNDQDFWDQSSSGTGLQKISWNLQPGAWTVVIMNADGSPGVHADAAAGANSPVLIPIAVALIVLSGVIFIAGLLLVIFGSIGLVRKGPGAQGPGAAGPAGAGAGAGAEPGVQRPPGSATGSHSAFASTYPANLTGTLSPNLSRGLWLVKWILAFPHWVILFFLWIAFIVATIIAGFAILFTGRYPRELFDFNVGVLRWSWRVAYYSYSVLGTDEYPPFTLESTNYPADFTVEYPEHLINGLVLVKWWLLAIPHLAIVAVFVGGSLYGGGWFFGSWRGQDNGGGVSLLGILVIVAGAILLFTGRYQRPLFDLVMGINRWVFRVLAYTSLMRDEYPPFRLDQGGYEAAPPPGRAVVVG